MKITIIGAGAFGSALGAVAKTNGHEVSFYDPQLFTTTLAEALGNSAAIIIAIPSQFVAETIEKLTNFAMRPIIIASKGLFADDINLRDNVSALAGAGFADELESQTPTILTASNEISRQIFANNFIKVELTADTAAILACGALKNIFAIGAGMLNLNPKSNRFANYIQTAFREENLALQKLELDQTVANLSCGLADLIMTCASQISRNYTFGADFAKDPNYQTDETTEGLMALNNLPAKLDDLPILITIREILARKAEIPELERIIFANLD